MSAGTGGEPGRPEAALLPGDPFAPAPGPDPLGPWLDALDRWAAGGGPHPGRATDAIAGSLVAEPEPAQEALRAVPPPPRRHVPPLAEIELAGEWQSLARWVGEDPARRLAAVSARVEGGWDRFGLAPDALRRAFPYFYALYRTWFRVRSKGHEWIPPDGPVVLAANHGGLLPFDGAMAVVDLLLHGDPPRLARAIVDRWAGSLPFVNVFFARVGQVVGTHENFDRLLDDGEAVLVFPEGMEGIRKPITQRHRLQRFHVGFVEHALRARAPIVPVAILGSDDQAPILFDVKPLARLLGLPAAPITPTFPWFGPLGLLPYPVSYRIAYGEPLRFHERFGSGAAGDPAVVRALAGQVRRAVQRLIDERR